MTCPCFRSRFRWLRYFCSLACLVLGCCSLPRARAQDISKPTDTIDDDVTAFAYAPDGRIVYSVRHLFHTKKYDLQRDDIWIREAGGRRRRIFQGEKFTEGDKPFSYIIDGFHWSPNGRLVLVAMNTASMSEDSGRTQGERMAIVLEDSGKQLHIGTYNVLHNATEPSWLQDSATIVYLTESIKPNVLFGFNYATLGQGPGGALFDGRTFLDYARLPGGNAAIAVERDRNMSGPPRIQRLDLLAQENQELATLDSFDSGPSVSPTGKRLAYFIDKEVLEIRDLAQPDHVARIRIGLGTFAWMPDENAIILKRAPEHKSGDLVRVAIPPLTVPPAGDPVPVTDTQLSFLLHGLTFRDFAISPDGNSLAVVPPGKHNLLIFPLPQH